MRLRHISILFASTFALATACGGGQPEPVAPEPMPEPAPTAEAPPEPEPEPEVAPEPAAPPSWGEMNKEQKVEHMKTVVLPKMTAVFQEFDAKRYKEVGCPTCHGPGAKEGKFEMPNKKLPKLTSKNSFAKHMKKKKKVTEFMMQKVLPAMAGTLGTEPYNPDTQKGFGCGGCHVVE